MGDTISRRKALGMMTATLALPLLGCREDLFAPQPSSGTASVAVIMPSALRLLIVSPI